MHLSFKFAFQRPKKHRTESGGLALVCYNTEMHSTARIVAVNFFSLSKLETVENQQPLSNCVRTVTNDSPVHRAKKDTMSFPSGLTIFLTSFSVNCTTNSSRFLISGKCAEAFSTIDQENSEFCVSCSFSKLAKIVITVTENGPV